ncbi:MAG: RDD family protein [Pseudomonadota bacterium]
MTTETAHITEAEKDFVFDPVSQPELFEDVRRRRVFAYLIDLVLVSILVIIAAAVVAVVGVLTLGLGWLLYGILVPGTALLYIAFTLGSSAAATPGMRFMGLQLRLWYGPKPYMLLAVMHAILFYAFNLILTPFIVLVSLFNERKRLLHDIVLGTVVINVLPGTDPMRRD